MSNVHRIGFDVVVHTPAVCSAPRGIGKNLPWWSISPSLRPERIVGIAELTTGESRRIQAGNPGSRGRNEPDRNSRNYSDISPPTRVRAIRTNSS
jgi:hypothetical protein